MTVIELRIEVAISRDAELAAARAWRAAAAQRLSAARWRGADALAAAQYEHASACELTTLLRAIARA